MTQDILIVLHSESSTPGRIGHMLAARGHRLDIRRPCLGDPLPPTMANHAGAVIFGGPMSANDSDDWISREIDWIGVPLKEDKPFLGVCLGAQMLSKHLGGSVGPHADGLVEIGYYPLRPTEHGQGLGLGPWPEHVYHWHREGLSLPSGTVHLATGDTFENQAFRYSGKAYGIQFHPEVTRLTMHRWAVLGAHRFVMPNAQHARAHLDANLVHDGPVKNWLTRFLDHWLSPAA
ncbi:glutamine amidotransferase [Aestuariivirga sp.]|uniref:glutamine amidotransferase n=1 Tax=Aestuariivirga sp. TaxID=2650926 RepID=UPI0035941450